MLESMAFALESGNIHWRFHVTERLGKFDIAIPADHDLSIDANALTQLEAAIAHIDTLYETALAAAEQAWLTVYKGRLRDRSAWSLVRLFAQGDGQLVLTLHEGEFDTYCVWDVAIAGAHVTGVEHRAFTASAG